jgi:hypothetical protein
MLLALAIFLIVSAAGFSLLVQHQPLFTEQQNIAGMNISLRNAVSELQIDLANAGTGYYPGANIPDWPVGVAIVNNPVSSSCYTASTNTYGASCFDSLSVIAVDDNSSALLHPQTAAGGCIDTSLQTQIFAVPPTGLTAAQGGAIFSNGDQLLLVKSDGSQYTTVVLTANGSSSTGFVLLTHNTTKTDGSNTSANDPLSITTSSNSKLGISFCPTDWVMRLRPIKYTVDASNPANPKLQRTAGGVTDVVSEQVIGFKVGATIWNTATNTSSDPYNFNASTYGPNNDGTLAYQFTNIRSVRVSLIGRTKPNPSQDYTFRNTFDGGPYQVEGVSVIVDPRNMSMR